ncbi:MAG: hypothetical protein IJQ81_11375 [Oscillibacter sp.]|nr:hypothetical protein [Oscillibacter sp.]
MSFYCLRENRRIRCLEVERRFDAAREDYRLSRFQRIDIRPVSVYAEAPEDALSELDFWMIHGVAPLFQRRLAEKVIERTDPDNLLVKRVTLEAPAFKTEFYVLLPRAIDVLDGGGKIRAGKCGRYPIFKAQGNEDDIIVNGEMARILRGAAFPGGNLRLERVDS